MIGRINGIWMAFLASAVALAGLITVLAWPDHRGRATGGVVVYCAAGIKQPVMAAAREYEQAYGVRIQPTFAGSETLLTQARSTKVGDLYLPADESYIQKARQQNLLEEVLPLGYQRPVLAVNVANPKKIAALSDILKPGVKISQANPDAAAIGYIARQVFTKTGQWEEIQKHRAVTQETVNYVAIDIAVGTVDAGFVWDATVAQMPDKLKIVPVPALEGIKSLISIAVLKSSPHATEALRFARFLAARDKGLAGFKRDGYEPVDGDQWADEPVLHLFSGAMLRAAIEPTLDEFQTREGVKIDCNFNGCGVLVTTMKADPKTPDAYFACDVSFMDKVPNIFPQSIKVSTNQIVILVPRHNPKGIRTLADLARPGLRVAVGREKYGALGDLTRDLLIRAGCYEAVRKNVVVDSDKADTLLAQFRSGSLDAAIIYRSTAEASKEKLDIVHIAPDAFATQPFAIARDSNHKYLAARLQQALVSPRSRQRFEELGFQWLLDK